MSSPDRIFAGTAANIDPHPMLWCGCRSTTADGTEIEKIGTAPLMGKRYYPTAVRDNSGLKWVATNHQGTFTIQIDPHSLTPTRRRFMPYGEPRCELLAAILLHRPRGAQRIVHFRIWRSTRGRWRPAAAALSLR